MYNIYESKIGIIAKISPSTLRVEAITMYNIYE